MHKYHKKLTHLQAIEGDKSGLKQFAAMLLQEGLMKISEKEIQKHLSRRSYATIIQIQRFIAKFKVAIQNFIMQISYRTIIKTSLLLEQGQYKYREYTISIDIGEKLIQKAMSEIVNESFQILWLNFLLNDVLLSIDVASFSNQEIGVEGLLNQ